MFSYIHALCNDYHIAIISPRCLCMCTCVCVCVCVCVWLEHLRYNLLANFKHTI